MVKVLYERSCQIVLYLTNLEGGSTNKWQNLARATKPQE
jgi:hypothetical protein